MSNPPPTLPQFLTPREVAPTLRMTPYQVAALCKAGKLRATRPGRTWLIEPQAVLDYLASGEGEQAAS